MIAVIVQPGEAPVCLIHQLEVDADAHFGTLFDIEQILSGIFFVAHEMQPELQILRQAQDKKTESTERLFKLHDAVDADGTVGHLKRQMPKTNYFNAYPQAVSRRLRDAH